MEIGILDFGEIDADSNGLETIHNTIANAVLAEEKGFKKYWLTEHYITGLAWRNPELIILLIAASTNTINVGAAGILVSLNAPFRVAQDFKLISNLFPNRIDLGFAKGNIDFEKYVEITNQNVVLDFYEKISKTQSFLKNEIRDIPLTPLSSLNPDLWMLGTSSSSINFAVEKQMNFSLSLFHNLQSSLPSPKIIDEFKNQFIKTNKYEPQVNIALSVFCSGNENRVNEEIQNRKNVLVNIAGNQSECLYKIKEIAKIYNVNEAIVLNLGKNYAEKQFLIENLLNDKL